jgi:hypothetical protein
VKASGLTLEWTLRKPRRELGKRASTGSTARTDRPGKVPRVTRLMALAIKFEGMVACGEVHDYADLARLGFVTRARMTQIMNLLNLAPDIQEAILFTPPTNKGRDPMSERSLRKVTAIVSWTRQRAACENFLRGTRAYWP